MAQLQLLVLTVVVGVALCAVQGQNAPRHRHGHPHNVTKARVNGTDAVVGHVNLASNLTEFANGSLPFLFGHYWNATGSEAHRANATLRDMAGARHNQTDETSLRRGHGHAHNVTNARTNVTYAAVGHIKLATNLTAFVNGSLESLIGHHWNATGVDAHRANATLLGSTAAKRNHTDEISVLAGNITNLQPNVTNLHELTDAQRPSNGTVLVNIDRRANHTEDAFQRRHHHTNSTNFHAYNASRIQPHDWNVTAFELGVEKFNATAQMADVELRGRRHPHPRNATEAH